MVSSLSDREYLDYWADIGDNRVGPLLRELVDVMVDCDDPDKLRRVASRLKFMSGSLNSYANRLDKARRGY